MCLYRNISIHHPISSHTALTVHRTIAYTHLLLSLCKNFCHSVKVHHFCYCVFIRNPKTNGNSQGQLVTGDLNSCFLTDERSVAFPVLSSSIMQKMKDNKQVIHLIVHLILPSFYCNWTVTVLLDIYPLTFN